MSWNIAAYVEKKNDKGAWELVTKEPVGNCLKYILEDFSDLPKVSWDDLSDGMKEIFKKDENGQCYCSFYSTTLGHLEEKSSRIINESFSKVNTIVKALGCHAIFDNDGEELDIGYDDEKESRLTFPVNKELIEDLQFILNKIRNAGQREAFDLLVSQYMEFGQEYRVLIVYS